MISSNCPCESLSSAFKTTVCPESFRATAARASFKAATAVRGFNFGPGRVALTESQRQDYEAMKSTMQCIVSELGYASPPAAGCTQRSRSPFPGRSEE